MLYTATAHETSGRLVPTPESGHVASQEFPEPYLKPSSDHFCISVGTTPPSRRERIMDDAYDMVTSWIA
jgi:hypothetical protein